MKIAMVVLCMVVAAATGLSQGGTERAEANHASQFSLGDIFVGNGTSVEWLHPWDASLHVELSSHPDPGVSTNSEFTPLSFDADGNLYVPNGDAIHRYDRSGVYLGTWGTGLDWPMSVAFDDKGFAYVGQWCTDCPSGTPADDIVKLDPAGNEVDRFDAEEAHPFHGTGIVDIGPDHCTLYYANNSQAIKRYGICAENRGQLPDFAQSYHEAYHEFRVTPQGDVLAVDKSHVHLIGSAGEIKRTWDPHSVTSKDVETPPSCMTPVPTTTTTTSTTSTTLPVTTLPVTTVPTVPTTPPTTAPEGPCTRGRTGFNQWTGVNLDPDGTSFWSGDFLTNKLYRFDFDDPAAQPRYVLDWEPARPGGLLGLAVFGEIKAGAAPTVGISNAEVVEPPTGTRTMSFTLSLSSPVDVDVAVRYFTGDGPDPGGARGDVDFRPVSGEVVTIPAGKLQVPVTVEVLADDDVGEGTETFFANITEDSEAIGVHRPQGTGTIYEIVAGPANQEDDHGRAGSGEDHPNRGASAPGGGGGGPTQPAPGPGPNPSSSPAEVVAPSPAPNPGPQLQSVPQPQPITQVQQVAQAQVQQAVQVQPAMMLERQREAQVQTAGLDGQRSEPWLATARRPAPAPMVAWTATVMALAAAIAWGAGGRAFARTYRSSPRPTRRRPASRQSPRHHREWGQGPW